MYNLVLIPKGKRLAFILTKRTHIQCVLIHSKDVLLQTDWNHVCMCTHMYDCTHRLVSVLRKGFFCVLMYVALYIHAHTHMQTWCLYSQRAMSVWSYVWHGAYTHIHRLVSVLTKGFVCVLIYVALCIHTHTQTQLVFVYSQRALSVCSCMWHCAHTQLRDWYLSSQRAWSVHSYM